MILLHRITPFFLVVIAGFGFWFILNGILHPVTVTVGTCALVALLFARLLEWKFRLFSFWHFLGTPSFFLLASFGMIFLFEEAFAIIGLSVLSAFLIGVFAEYVFQYTHLPSRYQPYSIEHLSVLLNILTIFFISAAGFGAYLLAGVPLWVVALIFFLISFFIIYGTLWVRKTDEHRARPYSFAGALLSTEFFAVLTFLPTGFYSNAAFITLFFYTFLGLTRAEALHKLSKTVIKRYMFISVFLLFAIIVSSKWI